jgi:Uma2 family endonuclease
LRFPADDGIVVRVRRIDPMAAPKLVTIDDYFRTPETVNPAELAFGVLRVADAPTPRHQSAVAQLFLALREHVRARRLGQVWLSPLDVVLDEQKALIVQPDLMYISNEREWIVEDRVRGAPDLIVEVLSPNPRIGRTDEHVQWFAQYGVRECWLVYQDQKRLGVVTFEDRRVVERRLVSYRETISSRLFPEWSLSLADILEQ